MGEYKIDYCHHDSVTAESRQENIRSKSMSRETSLIKKIAMLNEDDIPHDSYMLTILCDIAESLAVIADKLTEEQENED